MKKLSIITINFNNAKGLCKTIESVVQQTSFDFEYIIIDGGSTDGSLDFIKQYESGISYWVSEPDKGIYNAMNKGLQVAKGEYCLLLNSGDYLYEKNSIEQTICQIENDSMIVACLLQTQGGILYPNARIAGKRLPFVNIDYPIQQATYIKLDLFKKYGYFNEENKIVSDIEFYLITLDIHNEKYQTIAKVLSYFEGGGISSQRENQGKMEKEFKEMYNRHFPKPYNEILFNYQKDLSRLSTKRWIMLQDIEKNRFLRIITSVLLTLPFSVSKLMRLKK